MDFSFLNLSIAVYITKKRHERAIPSCQFLNNLNSDNAIWGRFLRCSAIRVRRIDKRNIPGSYFGICKVFIPSLVTSSRENAFHSTTGIHSYSTTSAFNYTSVAPSRSWSLSRLIRKTFTLSFLHCPLKSLLPIASNHSQFLVSNAESLAKQDAKPNADTNPQANTQNRL